MSDTFPRSTNFTAGEQAMALEKTFIPYGCYWSTPFCRWQGSLADHNALKLVAQTAGRFLEQRQIPPATLESLVLGYTVPQKHFFYGAPWVAGMLGAPDIGGQMVSQACATSVRVLANATAEVELGGRGCVLGLACDRTSNGPHIYYPNPKAPGGRGDAEDPVWDNFSFDPWAKNAMIDTAEQVAAAEGITREEQDQVTLLRDQQYRQALADDAAFLRRFMVPVQIPLSRNKTRTLELDEGVFPTTAEGLAKLRPVKEGGSVTFGSQTYPADGNAGVLVCDEARARELSSDPARVAQVVAFGEARTGKGLMPTAVVPAAQSALSAAGIAIGDCAAIKTHNPFAVNDVYLARKLELAPERVNNYGSPLIWGHPQGPTGLRAVLELMEELVLLGGGYGLFSGCAAGDTAMGVVIKI
jgi:acetyl-CoA acetyltransferase